MQVTQTFQGECVFLLRGEVYSKKTAFSVSITQFAWLIKELTGLKPENRLGNTGQPQPIKAPEWGVVLFLELPPEGRRAPIFQHVLQKPGAALGRTSAAQIVNTNRWVCWQEVFREVPAPCLRPKRRPGGRGWKAGECWCGFCFIFLVVLGNNLRE